MVFACVAVSDDSSADSSQASASIEFKGTYVGVEDEIEADITFDYSGEETIRSITYEAKLVDSKGNTQTNAVSPSSGSLTKGVAKTIDIDAPKTAGTYRLQVTFTCEFQDESVGKIELTKEQSLRVVGKITLTATISNQSDASVTLNVDFYVDGSATKVNDDPVSVTVAAHSTADAKYTYAPEFMSNGAHTYCIKAAEGQVGGELVNLDQTHTFYVGDDDYRVYEYLLVALFVFLLFVLVWVYRKPVVNRGKPKSRR